MKVISNYTANLIGDDKYSVSIDRKTLQHKFFKYDEVRLNDEHIVYSVVEVLNEDEDSDRLNIIVREMELNNFFDYFDKQIEYPKNVAENPLPVGVCYDYIGSSFLDGFINLTRKGFLYCFVLNRYTREDYKLESFNNKTKVEVINDINSGAEEFYHTKFNKLEDDVLILSRINENMYMFFWYDMDCSDCMVGRFETYDSPEVIKASLMQHLIKEYRDHKEHEEHHEDENGFHELDVNKFLKGWVSF